MKNDTNEIDCIAKQEWKMLGLDLPWNLYWVGLSWKIGFCLRRSGSSRNLKHFLVD